MRSPVSFLGQLTQGLLIFATHFPVAATNTAAFMRMTRTRQPKSLLWISACATRSRYRLPIRLAASLTLIRRYPIRERAIFRERTYLEEPAKGASDSTDISISTTTILRLV